MVVHHMEAVGPAGSRILFEHSSDGVLFVTEDGRIAAANPAACELLETSLEELSAMCFDELLDPDDPRWNIAAAERDRTGSACSVGRLRRRDGRYIELEAASRRFREDDGSVRVCTVLRDLTSRIAVARELEELSARLVRLSRADELTGLPNRRGLIASGTHLLQCADRHGVGVQVAFVDVGNVKELNERHGHQAGDAALQAVARSLSVTFRPRDVLARVGGTAFLALALKLPASECAAIAGRVREYLVAAETVAFVGAPVEVAFGWTLRQAGDGTSLEELMARSDWAMLEAREARETRTSAGS
jgi:diguanylate cyclase (GGDEF)-like protein/PAS domain S-box-containing protein